MIDYGDFEVLTFDCYGTLIDWEAGLIAALSNVLPSADAIESDDLLRSSCSPDMRSKPSAHFSRIAGC